MLDYVVFKKELVNLCYCVRQFCDLVEFLKLFVKINKLREKVSFRLKALSRIRDVLCVIDGFCG